MNWFKDTPIIMDGVVPYQIHPPKTPFKSANDFRWRCYIPLICHLRRQGFSYREISDRCAKIPAIAHASTDVLPEERYFPPAWAVRGLFIDAKHELLNQRVFKRTRRIGRSGMAVNRRKWIFRMTMRCRRGVRNDPPNTGKWQDWTPEMQAEEFRLN